MSTGTVCDPLVAGSLTLTGVNSAEGKQCQNALPASSEIESPVPIASLVTVLKMSETHHLVAPLVGTAD